MALLLSCDLRRPMRRELVPRFRYLQQYASLFWRARKPSHRTALVAVLAVLFSCLYHRR
jgi:hypothetical protein